MDPGGIQGLSGIKITERIEDISKTRRPGKRPSSPERWELAQLKHAGVLKVTEYPDFDAEGEVRPAGCAAHYGMPLLGLTAVFNQSR